jgi:type IV secretion system protein VirB3
MPEPDRPREAIIHQSANRPNQILGGDRELVLIAILTAVSLAFSLATWWGLGVSVAFWIGCVAVLQRMGKADPLLPDLHAPCEVQAVLSGKERLVLPLPDTAADLEIRPGNCVTRVRRVASSAQIQ